MNDLEFAKFHLLNHLSDSYFFFYSLSIGRNEKLWYEFYCYLHRRNLESGSIISAGIVSYLKKDGIVYFILFFVCGLKSYKSIFSEVGIVDTSFIGIINFPLGNCRETVLSFA